MKKLLLLFVVFLFAPLAVHAANDHLVINQIQTTGGAGLTTNDFVEIYNPTTQNLDLNGLRLVKRTQTGITDTLLKSWTDSVMVPPGGYYLWANSAFTSIAVIPDSTTSGSIADDNGVALRSGPNDTGAIIDSVAWGSATNSFVMGSVFATNPTAGQVLLRTQDSDNNSVDFVISTSNPHNSTFITATISTPSPTPTPDPTPSPAPDPTPTPPDPTPVPAPDPTPVQTAGGGGSPTYSHQIIISEFLPNPNGDDLGHEWVELYNQSNSAVDLSGWKLDDESADGSVGSSAYKIPVGTSIDANAYLAIDLPAGSFALDNTGGDSVRLIWPNDQVASLVSYTGTAAIDTAYARKSDGTYAWTTILTKGTANLFSVTEPTTDDNTDDNTQVNSDDSNWGQIAINEILPNPVGTDSGHEWIEVKNLGSEDVTMHGWILDDGAVGDPIGSTAYTIQSPTVKAGGVATITIPSGKFAMDNSGIETVRLFSPDKVLVDSVTYSGAKEGLSYAKLDDGTWIWGTPTPDAENIAPKPTVVINEILPYPAKGSEEFIELANVSDTAVDVTGWKLSDKDSSYVLPSESILPGNFLTIKRSTSNIALANTVKDQVELKNAQGVIVDAVEYDEAVMAQSFNLTDKGDYAWSTQITPDAANVIKDNGIVAGATLVRTGNDQPWQNTNPTLEYIALFVAIWYIATRLFSTERKSNEQARID